MATWESSGMHFIVSTDVKKADPETRKLIRSHVMLGKNRTKSSKAKRRKVTTSRASINDHSQAEPAPLDEVINACRSVIPRRVGSDLSLANFAVELEPAKWGDIIKFFTISMRIMYPLAAVVDFHRKEKSWFEPYALDAAYIHVTVFAVDAFAEKITRHETQSVKQKAGFHFLKGVQLLRERLLMEDEEVKVSDSTTSAVLTLALSAKLVGEYETAKQHMEGLRKIVNLRGGLGQFGDKKLVMEILRCDIAMALHTGSSTVFFDDSILEPLVPYPGEILCSIQKCAFDCESEYGLNLINEGLSTAWSAMASFCSLVNFSAQTQQILSLHVCLDTMASVMYRLLQMDFETGSTNEIIRLGILAFSYHIFLQWQGVTMPYLTQFSEIYRSCVSVFEPFSELHSQLMLWILIIGGISKLGGSDDSWVKESLRRQLEICQVRSWDEMRGILETFMWIGILHDKQGKDIFDSVSHS